MNQYIQIENRKIGTGLPVYIIAEMSANHNHDINRAIEIIRTAKEVGADAVKLQTYTPDTMTIDCDRDYFKIKKGTIWEGRNLYDLYSEAYTPWEWHPQLLKVANEIGIDLFSTPFDLTAVEYLEELSVPAYKIASFENIDLPLIRRIAETGKPIIMSTGMASLAEIDEAVQTIREAGGNQISLLKCTSAYPASPSEMNLRTIPHLAEAFDVVVGLSDHTLGIAVPVAAVALGACIIEKHFTLSRDLPSPDSVFSLEPNEFKEMILAIRAIEKALGTINYGCNDQEASSRVFRRSLFVVEDIEAGEEFTPLNVRSIRPGYGLHPRYLDDVIGRSAAQSIKRGTPLSWDLIYGR